DLGKSNQLSVISNQSSVLSPQCSDKGLTPQGKGHKHGSAIEILKALLSWPTIASKNWVYRQYDYTVRDGSVVCPGSDAAVLRVKADSLPGTGSSSTPEKFIAISVDCNATYVYLDPYLGGKLAVAEAARNLAC